MRRAWNDTKRGMARFWQGLREWSGDAAYEKYRKCALQLGQESPLSPGEFYVEEMNRKYSQPNRCC
jgi:Selenoprotein, putative